MASELLERDLYGGKYHLTHNPEAKGRQPRYVVTDSHGTITKPKGVTTILGGTLAKDFIGWALNCMSDYLTGKLPSITAEDIATAKKESDRLKNEGASTGTETHAMVENYLKGKVTDDAHTPEATNAYKAFVDWFETATPVVINVEEVIYSPTLNYCGTYDCMLEIDGKVVLCDLKTTKASRGAPQGVYSENFLQLGAYAAAHEEQRLAEGKASELRKIEDLMVISARKDGELDIVTASEMGLGVKICGDTFKKVVEIYTLLAEVKKNLGGR